MSPPAGRLVLAGRAEGPAAGRRVLRPGVRPSELAERPHVNQQSAFHLGEGRSHVVIVFVRERCCQMLPEPVEILADDAADLLVDGGPMPECGGVRPDPVDMLASGLCQTAI